MVACCYRSFHHEEQDDKGHQAANSAQEHNESSASIQAAEAGGSYSQASPGDGQAVRTSSSTSVPTVLISKKRAIEALLRGPKGIGVTELMAATGWQAHSIRAALTAFRKSGCTIKRDRDESGTRYRIVEAA